MFADDIALVAEMVAKYSAKPPFVEAGGIENPTIADYARTIRAMESHRFAESVVGGAGFTDQVRAENLRYAQMLRYLQIRRPLEASCPGYVCEDPATGGLPLERLSGRYDPSEGTGIGTAILLSVLEHVDDPFIAIDCLREAMAPGGLVIVSVPFIFPEHAECGQDCWRFTPTALRHLFSPTRGSGAPPVWEVLEADWRLRISASAGILNIKNGEPQAIESCYCVARAV